MIGKLWKLLSPFHGTFGWFVKLLIVYEGLQIAEGYLISLVVRLYGEKAQSGVWIILFLGLLVYDELFMRLDNAVDWHVITKHSYPIYRHLKLSAVAKFMEMDIPWHQNHNSGALVGKVANGVWKVLEIVDGLSWEFVPTLIQTLLSLIPLVLISPIVAFAAVVAFGLFMWLSFASSKKRRTYRRYRHDLYEEEWHKSIELVQSVETNLMFGQRERRLAEQTDIHDRIMSIGKEEAKVGIYTFNRWRIRILSWARRFILVVWIWQLFTGSLDVANLIFVSVLTEKLFHSFWRYARLLDRTSEASEGAERLVDLMGQKSKLTESGDVEETKTPISIEMKGVCFAYGDSYDPLEGALHDFSLSIPGGSIVALVGPSGAGKTTVRKVITRLVEIQEGNIEIAGFDIDGWPLGELLRLFSYVPQGDDVFIFAGSIAENITFPRPEASETEISEAARLAGIHDFIQSLPDGYLNVVGERGKRLSGGQKQRVALARAILADRPVLILDEATSAVDAITEKEIQEKMRTILAGKTAIVIAHRLSTVWDLADKIVVMDEGRKVEEGSHGELVKNRGLYARMVALQTSR